MMILILIIIITQQIPHKTDISYSNQNKHLVTLKFKKKEILIATIHFFLLHPLFSSQTLFLCLTSSHQRQRKHA